MRHGKLFTVQDFHDENPVHVIIQSLEGGAFGHGLPQDFSDQPNVVALFRTLLKDCKFERQNDDEDGPV